MSKQTIKRIVITGVGRGLGRAMADGFIAAGHVVFGCSFSSDAIIELRRQYGEPHSFRAVDVTQEAEVGQWAKEVLSNGGPPDLLVNNAGAMNRNAPLWRVPAEEFNRVIEVNVKGVANVLRRFLPAMIESGSGVIVNFSSGWGRSVSAEVAPYCASKWAVEGLTRALADELPAGMAAVPLNPGIINTEMLQSCFGADASHYPDAAAWAKRAVPMFLKLGPKDNGRPLTVEGF
jgi:NAD(P)-dependent dehydrogenase (short-subunit alcohol dehydrogenase family)